MRTPNCKCVVCDKPLYRRPSDQKKARFSACMLHRAEAQVLFGQTDKQKAALDLGREKGTNHLSGIPKSKASKQKRSVAMRRWCAENPDGVVARSRKIRGPNHYKWNGGSSRLNVSIRQMNENRKWMDAVKERDEKCVRCGSVDKLESHHAEPLVEVLERLEIKTRDDARKHAEELWDLNNGIALCQRCHYVEHGRVYAD